MEEQIDDAAVAALITTIVPNPPLPLAALFYQARSYEGAILTGDSDAVHQYRVHLRRLRALLGLVARLQPLLRLELVREHLQVMMAKTSGGRDLAVAIANLEKRAVASDLDAAYLELATTLRGASGNDRKAITTWLDSSEYLHRCEAVDEVLRLLPPLPPPADWCHALARSGARLSRAIRDVDSTTNVPELHRLRIRIKRLRYRIELICDAQSTLPRPLKALRKWHRRLGELHDQAVLVELLEGLDQPACLNELAPTTLVLLGRLLEREANQLKLQQQEAIRDLRRSKLAALERHHWRQLLEQAQLAR